MIAVLALLFLAKSIVPLGFMPSFGGEHATAITICSSLDEVQIFVNDSGEKVPAPSDHRQSSICEFSLASIFTHHDTPILSIVASFISAPDYDDAVSIPLTVSAHHFHARAPPILQI